MNMFRFLYPKRVYRRVLGGVLKHAIPGSGIWADGSDIHLEAATHFEDDGGEGVFDPHGETPEPFSYGGVIRSSSDDPGAFDALTGVQRDNPVAWPEGVEVQSGSEPYEEMVVDGHFDGEEEVARAVPVFPTPEMTIEEGVYGEDANPLLVMDVGDEEDSQPFVWHGALGVPPLVDTDNLPAIPGGDDEPGSPSLPGGGYEDDEPPGFTVTPEVEGGINSLIISWITGPNSSYVRYKVYVSNAPMTETDNDLPEDCLVTVHERFGRSDEPAGWTVTEFPADHHLHGSEWVYEEDSYHCAVVPTDGAGPAVGPHPQVTGAPKKIEAVDIEQEILDLTHFAQSIRPVAIVTSLPSLPDSLYPVGAVVVLTTDRKLYRNDNGTWTRTTPTTDLTGQVTTTQITDNAISTGKIAADAVTAAKIAANTITANEIATDTITAGQIAAGAINVSELAANAVTAQKIAAGAVIADKIASNAITTVKIDALAVTADKIAANSITAAKIVANSVTADKLDVSTLSAITADLGTVNAGSITGVTITGGTIQSNTPNSARIRITNTPLGEDPFRDTPPSTAIFFHKANQNNDIWTASISLRATGALELYGDQGVLIDDRATIIEALFVDTIDTVSAARVSFPSGLGIQSGKTIRFNDTFNNASTGSQGAPPSQVAGYFLFERPAGNVKVPFYNT